MNAPWQKELMNAVQILTADSDRYAVQNHVEMHAESELTRQKE